MSDEIYEGTVYITRYTGPATQGIDRARWQFTFPDRRDYVSVDRAEAEAILRALGKSLGFVSLRVVPVPSVCGAFPEPPA